MKNLVLSIFAILLSTIFFNVYAQSTEPKYEVGVKVNVLDVRKISGEKPAGFGGIFGYNLNKNISLETEVAHFPKDPSGNFGQTIAMFGVKAGIRTNINGDKFGFFLKARPGFIKFDRNSFAGDVTKPLVDVGGVVEYYPIRNIALRADFGAAIIGFGNDTVRTITGNNVKIGTTANPNFSFGITLRF